MKRIDYGRPPDLQLARSSSVLVEGEGGGESQQSSPSSPPSLHLPLVVRSPVAPPAVTPHRASHRRSPNRFLCFRFPLLLGNNSQKEDREREGKRSWHSTGTPSPAMAVAITSAVVDFPTWRGREGNGRDDY